MSKVVTTTVLPDVDGTSLTIGAAGDNVTLAGNDFRANVIQDAGGNAVFTSDGSGVLSGVNSGFDGAMKLLSTATASNQASIAFGSSLITNAYDLYIFKFFDLNPATDNSHFKFKGSTDNGSSFVSGSSLCTTKMVAYQDEDDTSSGVAYQTSQDLPASSGGAYEADSPFLASQLANDADACLSGEMYLFAPASTTYVKHWHARMNFYQAENRSTDAYTGGYFKVSAAINYIVFRMYSGNLDAVIKLYGVSKT